MAPHGLKQCGSGCSDSFGAQAWIDETRRHTDQAQRTVGWKVNEIVRGIGLCLAAFSVVGIAGLAAEWIAVLLILVTRQIKGE